MTQAGSEASKIELTFREMVLNQIPVPRTTKLITYIYCAGFIFSRCLSLSRFFQRTWIHLSP